MAYDYTELVFLFVAAFAAATFFPAQSEIMLVALHTKGVYSSLVLISVASVGNVLGSVVNWVLGRYLLHFQDRKWFPFKTKKLEKATRFYQKYGVWTLLCAWMPFIGDPLTLIAGIFRTNIGLFILLVTIGKVARYWLLIAIVEQL